MKHWGREIAIIRISLKTQATGDYDKDNTYL